MLKKEKKKKKKRLTAEWYNPRGGLFLKKKFDVREECLRLNACDGVEEIIFNLSGEDWERKDKNRVREHIGS